VALLGVGRFFGEGCLAGQPSDGDRDGDCPGYHKRYEFVEQETEAPSDDEPGLTEFLRILL